MDPDPLEYAHKEEQEEAKSKSEGVEWKRSHGEPPAAAGRVSHITKAPNPEETANSPGRPGLRSSGRTCYLS